MGQKHTGHPSLMSERITFPVSTDVSLAQGYNIVDDSVTKSIILCAKPSLRKIDYSHYSADIVRTRKDIRNVLKIPISKEMKCLSHREHQGKLENLLQKFQESEIDTQILIKFIYKKYSEFIENDSKLKLDQRIISEIQALHSFLINYGDHFCVERIFGGMVLIMLTIQNDSIEERNEIEQKLNLGYTIVNPMIGIDTEIFEKIPKEKIHFTTHYVGVDNQESENFDNVETLMAKIQEYRKEKENHPTLIQISLQSYKFLPQFESKMNLVRDANLILRELNDGLMHKYSGYFDFKNEIEILLEEYLKNQDKYEKLDINHLANMLVEINGFMEKIWKYFDQHAHGIELKDELDVTDISVYQSQNPIPKLKLKPTTVEGQ